MKNSTGDENNFYKDKDVGQVLCSLSIYPKDIAEKHSQGVGRESPNTDPFLPEPQGRLVMSFNPWTMLKQLPYMIGESER